ncbi:hypothetical protein [Corynebacterium variabile]|uniref:hypothetical protein n=1 Tax=Corynebacterium variabile TaxID=1727 RepID=UPI003F91965B
MHDDVVEEPRPTEGENMTKDQGTVVPVLTLATEETHVPDVLAEGPLTAEKLTELRTVLAVMADHPVTTLEIRPMPETVPRSSGISLNAVSPLATHLSKLIRDSAKNSSTVATATSSGENIYRMVVPAKVAAQFGTGVVKPMTVKGVEGGIRSALVGAKGITAHATFVPVKTATKGAAAGAALTVAGPLVLMAVAAGAAANAEAQQRQALEKITTLLEELKQEKLDDERSDLKGSAGAVKKAAAILLDRGEVGHSLGLDSAVHTIDKELSRTEDRLGKWRDALRRLPEDKGVELSALKAFSGVAGKGGQFRTHLEIATLAIALKRRVIVLQAVEHAQASEGNVFERFSRELKTDQERIDELESGINDVLLRLSSLQIKRQSGFRSPVFTGAEVDKLMKQAHRIHSLGKQVEHRDGTPDVAIDIARRRDGSVTVLPAVAAG